MNIHYYDKNLADSLNELNGTILMYAGGFALLMLVSAGIYYAVSGSNPSMQKKAKRMAAYAVIGLLFVVLSYSFIEVIEQIAT